MKTKLNISSCLKKILDETNLIFTELSILHKSTTDCPPLKKHEKCLAANSVTQTPCCILKGESHPLFHQSVTQLTTVKLGFDQIRTMICVSSGFRCSLLFLALFVASQTLAKDAANSVSSTATKRCNNVYNSFYAGPNRETETTLQEIKKILTHVEDDINILKENKTLATGKSFADSGEKCYCKIHGIL